MGNPLVSVIVPSYNQGVYLAETLNSVLNQTYTTWECIIIDDGSTDNTKEVALDFCHLDKRYQYLYQNNQGVSAARNNAIRHSSGKYILPLDGDDIIVKTYLTDAVPVLENDNNVKVVYGNAEYFGAKSGLMLLKPFSLPTLLNENCIFNTAMYRRTDYDKIAGYDETMTAGYEDWEFWISLLSNGGSVYKLSTTVLLYRIKEKSRNTEVLKSLDAYTQYVFDKHRDIYRHEFQKVWIAYDDITNSRLYTLFIFLRKLKRLFL